MCEGFLYLFSYFNLGCLSVPVSVCLSLLWTAVKKNKKHLEGYVVLLIVWYQQQQNCRCSDEY